MPWKTDEDVAKHKKGLTSKQAAQWRRIANAVLKKCMAKGGSEESCAASAIKQANGVVNANAEMKGTYSTYKQTVNYEPELVVHQGKAYLKIPVVMMVEGVHNGSQGSLLHEISELGKFPASWNGRPVVIYHPTDEEGIPISANNPETVEKSVVGTVYNTEVDGTKLKAEVWLDEDKLNTVSEQTLNEINDSKEMEVSLGMFTENEMTTGEWNGEEYEGIARNHRPDHLALLPDQVGACSCADGCGLGANKNNDMKLPELLEKVRNEGFSINQIGNHSDTGYREKYDLLSAAIRGLNTDNVWHYIEEFYDDAVIYSKSTQEGEKMYKQPYKIEGGKVEFVGEPIEVHRKVEYIVNLSQTNSKGGKNMPKGKECPNCLKKVDALIANEKSPWMEADREWLLTQEETTLDKLAPIIEEKEKVVEKTIEINKLSPEDQAALAFGKKQLKERREGWIQKIQANTENVWTDEKLQKMDDDTLEGIAKTIKVAEAPVDHSFAGDFNVNREKSTSGGALYPPGVEIKSDN